MRGDLDAGADDVARPRPAERGWRVRALGAEEQSNTVSDFLPGGRAALVRVDGHGQETAETLTLEVFTSDLFLARLWSTGVFRVDDPETAEAIAREFDHLGVTTMSERSSA